MPKEHEHGGGAPMAGPRGAVSRRDAAGIWIGVGFLAVIVVAAAIVAAGGLAPLIELRLSAGGAR